MADEYLYPAIEPYNCGWLAVEAPHRIYFEECGNRSGIPVVFLHGGPGSGCSPAHRRFFNPQRYHSVLFDQRGAGHSEPAGCLDKNTTQDLLRDLERLRTHLSIDSWLLYGGSWGATLALLYAQQHPQRVLGLVLRGVFLARQRDVAWVYGREGVSRLFPRDYDPFIDYLTPYGSDDPIAAYHRLLTTGEPAVREAAARCWHAWEARVVRQFLPPVPQTELSDSKEMLRRALIVSHYASHDFFLGRNGLPLHLEQLQEKPCIIIHGQRDLVCPLEAAWTLHHAWPRSELRIVEEGGHVAAEPAIGQALVKAFDEMAMRLAHYGKKSRQAMQGHRAG
jgi:proline iminopeptidase